MTLTAEIGTTMIPNGKNLGEIEKVELSSELPSPLYLQLAKHLRLQITSGHLGENEALPGERELAEMFAISRVTVRKALSALASEGLLTNRQGSGWFTNASPHVEQRLSVLTSFSEDMQSRGFKPGVKWLDRNVTVANPVEALALNLRPGEEVARMNRLRFADNKPLCIELSVVSTRYLPDPLTVEGSLYKHLRKLGNAPHRALQRLSAVSLEPDHAELLELSEGAPALYIERRTFLKDGTPLEFVSSHYRGDAYDFIVELTLT